MITGIFFALGAGLLWGMIFVGPLLVPDYPGVLQSAGRYVSFGLIALPMAWYDRHRLKRLQRQDWLEAVKLSLVGNLIYYTCLSSSIQRTGAPISTMIIGTLPVLLAVSANVAYGRDEGKLPWGRLSPALLLIATGLVCVNAAELRQNVQPFDLWRYLSGIALALIAVVCWTWYPLRNARWLRRHACHKPTTWATAQGLATLPLAAVAYGVICLAMGFTHQAFPLPFGPRPMVFVPLMIAIGLLCSWLGAFCWNEASQRLPTVLVGPLIVFETLAGLTYTFLLRQAWPPLLSLTGIACLIIGVAYAVSIKPEQVEKIVSL
ncbi:Inner membrane protein YtfF [Sodalis glossinidius str. 'morsitans']|nr:DMT family transporter [Sodalis glossinidius]CRL44612.1 Inner membrane protein YtfF [Sodalis glossinidius str. 'morsitans']